MNTYKNKSFLRFSVAGTAIGAALLLASPLMVNSAKADFVILDDLIVDGSACIGFDCVNGEAFGFDTLRFKENNLRIKFDDTSTAASFPNADWQITINDSANGGQAKFSIDDISGGRTPFTIEANARSNSLYVDDGGRVGIRTSTPSTELHIIDGDTPTVRLQQDGSSGFAPQTWDLAGNETNFFVRDVTNGSTLPFRIRPGAKSSALDIAANGNVGIGTSSPDELLHLVPTSGSNAVVKFETAASPEDLKMTLNDSTGDFRIAFDDGNGAEFKLNTAGNLTIQGGLISTSGGGACTVADPCDRVFDPEVYTVPTIAEHAEEMWTNMYLPAVGPTKPDQPLNVTFKLTRMLNELEHAHIYIDQLNKELAQQKTDFQQRLAALEMKLE